MPEITPEEMLEALRETLSAEFPPIDGPQCKAGHPIEIIHEGYGICHDTDYDEWWPWAFSLPSSTGWAGSSIIGKTGDPIMAWVGPCSKTKQGAIGEIAASMNSYRSLPFDEDYERARLMPV